MIMQQQELGTEHWYSLKQNEDIKMHNCSAKIFKQISFISFILFLGIVSNRTDQV